MILIENYSLEQVQRYAELVKAEWDEDYFALMNEHDPKLYLGIENGKVVGGFALFPNDLPSDVLSFLGWVPAGATYMGYLVVDSEYRGLGFGKLIVREYLDNFIENNCWLVADKSLSAFYEKLGFRFVISQGDEVMFVA